MAMAELEDARYILLTTFKRDGSAVSTPVWITGSAGTYMFTTGDRAWKTRRLLNNPAVQVQACGIRGGIKPGATLYRGSGEVLTTAEAVRTAEAAPGERGSPPPRRSLTPPRSRPLGKVRLAVPGHQGG
jgi:uncharacterized protein